VPSISAQPPVSLGYIATAGTHIVSFPAILIAAVLSPPSTPFTTPVPLGARVISPFAASVIVIVPELVPEFVLKIRSAAPPVVTVSVPAPCDVKTAAAPSSPTVTVSAERTTSPVPLGTSDIFPLAASVIVIVPESVPEFVLKTRSAAPPVVTVSAPAPFEVNVAAAPESPTFTVSPARTTSPVPFGVILISIFESPPVDERVGPAPVAALAIVNSFTAELVAVNKANSFPLVSKIDVPIFGEVKVLFVKVCVPVSVTSPAGKVSISGLVPSFAVANTKASHI
jgi:hypothetical protein